MPILIMDRGVHLDPSAVRKALPKVTVRESRNIVEAIERGADCDVLVSMAHEVTDELITHMPRLRYICAMSAGTERLETLNELKPDVCVTSGRGIHGCPFRKSYPDVLVMQSSQDRNSDNGTRPLDCSTQGCIFL